MEAAYRDVLTPWLLLLYENEELKGVAALATQPEQTSASWLSGNTADYCDFLSDPSDREAMLNAVFSELRRARVNELSLSNLPADSPTVPLLRKLAGPYKYHTFLRTAYQCAQVKLGSEEERRTLKSRLNGRKIFRRGMNFLGRQGGVSLVHHTTWESIEPLLQPFSVAHIARFLATGRISNQVDARRRVFLARLARALSRSRMARPIAVERWPSRRGLELRISISWKLVLVPTHVRDRLRAGVAGILPPLKVNCGIL